MLRGTRIATWLRLQQGGGVLSEANTRATRSELLCGGNSVGFFKAGMKWKMVAFRLKDHVDQAR
jgi:hypothetical protein